MKEKVLNQSIFLYTCPNCGETFRLNYPTLYHQMEDLIMIYLVPESELEKTCEIFCEKNALADFHTEKYLNRVVTSPNQLVEKIQIFDAGKDDRIMELVKLLATDSILKNDPDKEFDELRFAVDDDGTNILVTENMQRSYSKKAFPWDNACIESFHSVIKREWLNRFKIRDYKQAYQLIFEYLETFYNTKRIHSHCNYMSPNEFERVYERTNTEAELLAG